MVDNRKLSVASTDIVAKESLEQFINFGFVLAKIPEVIQQNIRTTFSAGNDFFNTDLNEKILNQLPLDLGYRPYGVT